MSNSRYVQVPAAQIENLLTTKGFVAGTMGRERTYTRTSKTNPLLKIVVYSSCAEGKETARRCGEDAIRVVLIGFVKGRQGCYDSCLHKTKKILRTGSVEAILDRIWDRCGEAAKAAQKFNGPCQKCGSVTYSDSGRCVVRECRENGGRA